VTDGGYVASIHSRRFEWSFWSSLIPASSILMRLPSGVMVRLIQPFFSSSIRYRDAVCCAMPSFSARYSVEILAVRRCAPISASLRRVKRSRQFVFSVNLTLFPKGEQA